MKHTQVCRKMLHNGSRHSGSKHMSLLPVVYEYRKPHIEGRPGYYTMKYFHTLGCFPSGLEAPYRLDDFHKVYLQAYLPEELEDWLDEVRPLPIEQAAKSLKALRKELNRFVLVTPTKWRPKPLLTSLDNVREPLEDILSTFITDSIHQPESRMHVFVAKPPTKQKRISVPNSVTRHLLNNHFNELCEVADVLDETWDFIGSTPHRRALLATDEPTALDSGLSQIPQSTGEPHRYIANAQGEMYPGWQAPLPATAIKTIAETKGGIADLPSASNQQALCIPSPDVTYEDEICLIHLHNLVSRAACEAKEYDVGIALSQISLHSLAHDDTRAAAVHGNLASLWFEKGDYDTAIIHAQRCVLLSEYGDREPIPLKEAQQAPKQGRKLAFFGEEPDPRTQESVATTGYTMWSNALAQQDHVDDALHIAAKAAEAYPTSTKALHNLRRLQRFVCGRVASPLSKRQVRCYNEDRIRRAVARMPFRLVHRSTVSRSEGYQWQFWNHPAGLKYKYDPRGF